MYSARERYVILVSAPVRFPSSGHVERAAGVPAHVRNTARASLYITSPVLYARTGYVRTCTYTLRGVTYRIDSYVLSGVIDLQTHTHTHTHAVP